MPMLEVPWTAAGCALVVGAFVLAHRYMDRQAFLRLTIFRPWRGDPWPIGVQEQYDVAWRWQRPAAEDPVTPPSTTPVTHVTVGRQRH